MLYNKGEATIIDQKQLSATHQHTSELAKKKIYNIEIRNIENIEIRDFRDTTPNI